ncbi:MAG: DUF2088 domain-containing protein [Dehalococcoidia bacterium]|nr:DUF2088 domain-containing protein [Dehalococcoidia bacterium]
MVKPERPPQTELDKAALVTYVDDPKRRYVFHSGEAFRYERLPVGTRVIHPPPPLPPLQDVDGAIEHALEHPLDSDPLSARLRPGMKVTIAFDDLSLPLPPMRAPDLRGRIIEKVLEKLAAKGVDDVQIVAALGLHRPMTPGELRHAVGPRVFKAFWPHRLYNHDAEDKENFVQVGATPHGETVAMPKRIVDSDLLIYVNLNLAAMDGGVKAVPTGLTNYATLRHHHNVHTLLHSNSLMDPPRSALHDACSRMSALIERHVNVFKIETTLNTNTFPAILRHLQKPEWDWAPWERAVFQSNKAFLGVAPFELRRRIFHSIRAPYGLTGIAAGATGPVHEHTMANLLRQQAVPVQGQADVLLLGVPYLMPYNVNSILNPVLFHCLVLGYLFNLYRGKPLVRKGGVVIATHPLEARFHKTHHPSYIEFYERVLAQTHDQKAIEQGFEAEFAANPRYLEQYRHGYAFHGVHPFYAWYWAAHGQDHVGKVIVVGARDKQAADRLGYSTAKSLPEALEMAQSVTGPDPKLTYLHLPPIFLCDVT